MQDIASKVLRFNVVEYIVVLHPICISNFISPLCSHCSVVTSYVEHYVLLSMHMYLSGARIVSCDFFYRSSLDKSGLVWRRNSYKTSR